MKKINKRKLTRNVGLLFTGVVVATTLACKPELTCECQAGTLHVTGESCGVENGCQCDHAEGVRIEGIAVTNRGVSEVDFNNKKTQVTGVFGSLSYAKKTYIKGTIKEIKVTNAVAGDVSIVSGVVTVRVGHTAGDIMGAFNTYTSHIAMLYRNGDRHCYCLVWSLTMGTLWVA